MFQKILLAATPQIGIQTAPKAAFDLAREHEAELVLFHALPIGKNEWCSFDDEEAEATFIEATRKKIESDYADELKDIPNYQIRVESGAPDKQLLKIIHTEGIDLVVMGHHTGDIDRPDRMWGAVDTTISKVCANIFCPVLVVTHEMPKVSDIKRIVMATDFSTPSDSALCYAVQLAKTYDSHLNIFHVLDVGQSYPNPEYYMQDMNIFVDKAKERMERNYAGALKNISHSYDCWEGTPYVEILKQSRWSKADLLVMAQYSSSGDSASKSVGSTVIQAALSPGSPVLIVNYRARVCM